MLCNFVSQPDPAGRQSLKHSFVFDFMGSMVVDVVIWFGTQTYLIPIEQESCLWASGLLQCIYYLSNRWQGLGPALLPSYPGRSNRPPQVTLMDIT